jgi:hypothetical protein
LRRRHTDDRANGTGLIAEPTEWGVAPIHAATKTDFFVKLIDVQITVGCQN